MGEFINHTKLGTCENLYYTTFNQLLKSNLGQVNERHRFLKCDSGYRFRLPFPDETTIQMGHHKNYPRGFRMEIPENIGVEIAHQKRFIRIGPTMESNNDKHWEEVGVSIDCPFSENPNVPVNKWALKDKFAFEIVQQKHTAITGKPQLLTTVRCPYCGSLCNLDEKEMDILYNHFAAASAISKENEEYYKMHMDILTIARKGYKEFSYE